MNVYIPIYRSETRRIAECIFTEDGAMQNKLQDMFARIDLEELLLHSNLNDHLEFLNSISNMIAAVGYRLAYDILGPLCRPHVSRYWSLYENFLRLNNSSKLSSLKTGLLTLVHVILVHDFWDPLDICLEDIEFIGRSETNAEETIESLLALLQGYFHSDEDEIDGVFLGDYNGSFNIDKRLTLLLNQDCATDYSDRIQYMIDVCQIMETSYVKPFVVNLTNDAVEAAVVEDTSLISKIAKVREVLPDLGNYFTEQLLGVCNNDVQLSIQRVFEGNIPSEILHIHMTQQLPDLKLVSKHSPTSLVANNDREMEAMRAKMKKVLMNYDEYEDEYDDTYDDTGFDAGDRLIDGVGEREERAVVWKRGMVDVDGCKRDVDGKLIVEDPLLKPNLNRRSTPAHKEENESAETTSELTQRQKNKKHVNKSRVGNHSRKRGAMKKESKGLFGTQ